MGKKLTLGETPNIYKCNKAIWRKLSNTQKETYNNIRSHRQSEVIGQGGKKAMLTILSEEAFETISHNYACLAAWQTPK